MYYSICGLTVEMNPRCQLLRQRAEKYRIEEECVECDFSIDITEERIDEHIKAFKGLSRELAEYVLCGVEFYSKILDCDAFFLHSSAVEYENRAYLFTAPCGGGKSTHTSLWRKIFKECRMINDDKPVIRKINGVLCACGTPFSGKNDINSNIIVPLQAICEIEKAEENSIVRLTPEEAFGVLIEQTLRTVPKKRAEALLSLMDDVLTNIPVYRLFCNIQPEAAYISYREMSSAAAIGTDEAASE